MTIDVFLYRAFFCVRISKEYDYLLADFVLKPAKHITWWITLQKKESSLNPRQKDKIVREDGKKGKDLREETKESRSMKEPSSRKQAWRSRPASSDWQCLHPDIGERKCITQN